MGIYTNSEFNNIPSYHDKATCSYVLTANQLKNIMNKVQSGAESVKSLFQTNVMEAILSIKMYPFSLRYGGYRANDDVYIGEYNTTIKGHLLRNDFFNPGQEYDLNPFYPKTECRLDLVDDPQNFLSYEPYTTCDLYLPYAHSIQVPLSSFKTGMYIQYVTDWQTGLIQIFICDHNKRILYTTTGQIGFDIPVSATNQREIKAQNIREIIGAIPQFASQIGQGDVVGASTNLVMTEFDVKHRYPEAQIRGGVGNNLSQFVIPQAPFAVLTHMSHRIINDEDDFRKLYGIPYNATNVLSNMSGFTKVGEVHVDIPGCLESEREEIESLLKDGVIL